MKNRALTLSLAAALTFGLGACGTTSGTATESPTSGTNRPTATVTETAEPVEAEPAEAEPTAELTGADPGILKMGKSFTYSDGLQVTVSKPTAMTSTEYGIPAHAPGQSFEITVVNGTKTKFDPSMGFMTVQMGNTEAEEIFDTNYEGAPMTTILPGRESTYEAAFAGTDTKNMVLEFAPDFDRGSLIFTPDGK